VEFARWYQLTGGLHTPDGDEPVLFTSFAHGHVPLVRVLDDLGAVFGPGLEAAGVHWAALSDAEQRDVALQVLGQVPVLWIWDNVEPVAGFPSGTPSVWTESEQAELARFLRDLRGTKAKVLLTSRRDEQAWLGELPARVRLPGMPMAERVQLARAVAKKHGRRLTDVEDWRSLLEFSQGNPLTITVLVAQALRDGLRTKAQVEGFVARLRTGAAMITDQVEQGRARSLGAALSYGLEQAFSEPEQAQLALLHLFQGFVNVTALCAMGYPEADYCVPELRGLTRQADIRLLDRAAEIGLLTRVGDGYYTIHPALPWFFQQRFVAHYGSSGQAAALQAIRAYTEAIAALGDYYFDLYEAGRAEVIGVLRAEEANLAHAHALARAHGWWLAAIGAMQGLQSLYGHTGRAGEWVRLVDQLVPDLVDSDTDEPLPCREHQWAMVTAYRVHLAIDARDWMLAERLQQARTSWGQKRAAVALATPLDMLDDVQRHCIHSLAASVHTLGDILREQQRPDCVSHYEKVIELSRRIGARRGEAVAAFNLGHAYLKIPGLQDLDQAESWYRTSLQLHDHRDRFGRAGCAAQLGHVALERFNEARNASAPEEQLRGHLNDAATAYQQALDLTSEDAVNDLAVVHNAVGESYRHAGNVDAALGHYQKAIHYWTQGGNRYGAGQTRYNIALAFGGAGRLDDALVYAKAALRDFEHFGAAAAADIDKTQQLIPRIEQNLAPTQTSR
jgi:tetratricopeptide (TPR) repeat protein